MRNEIKPYLLSLDVEHEGGKIIQLSGIMLVQIAPNIYQICRNLNVYIKIDQHISQFIQGYTGITNTFLEQYGVSLEEAQEQWDLFVGGINPDDILLFSHGIFQDLELLNENGFDLADYELWDTYNMSRFLLQRDNHLSLQELVEEGGYMPIQQHNAYSDAFSNVMLYSYLLKLQGDE